MNASVHGATCSWKVMKQIQAWKSQIRHKLHLGWEAKSMSRDWKPLLSWERKKATLESSWSILIVEHKNGFPCLRASQNQESPSSSRNSPVDSCSRVLSMTPVYCFSQFSSVAQSCPTLATPWVAACQASLSITNCRSLLKLMSIESVMPSSHLILCHPLLLLPPIPPSIRVFSSESTLRMRWPKYWSFSFSISQ